MTNVLFGNYSNYGQNPCNLRHHSFIHQIGKNFSTRRIYERCYLVKDSKGQSHVGWKMLLYSWSKTRNYVILQEQVNMENHSKLKVFAQTKGMINISHWLDAKGVSTSVA